MFEHSWKSRANGLSIPKLNKRIRELLKKSNTVLDIWCVSGRLSTYVSKEAKYIWLSYSQSDIDAVKKRWHEAYLVNLDKESIPLEEESVDCIYAGHIIEHFEKQELIKLMNECKRVLKKNWHIILSTPTDYNSFFYAERTHIRPYNHWSLPGLLLDFGFTDVDWMYPMISFLPKKYQALLRFPFFFLKDIIRKEVFARGKK